jgi:hypothetical protein
VVKEKVETADKPAKVKKAAAPGGDKTISQKKKTEEGKIAQPKAEANKP